MESNPLKWHGGKSYLAKRIIELMPKHTHYVEPFFGGGAVLFAKPCEGVSEVVNDLYSHLSWFWSAIADPWCFVEFKRRVEAIPFSQKAFDDACRSLSSGAGFGNSWQDIAVSFFVRYRQSRQGLGKDFATLSRNRTRRGMNEQVSSWLSAIEGLPEAHERLRRVVILNDDACPVIKQQDGASTLFYCDPPYMPSVRSSANDYEREMSVDDHEQLLKTLSRIKGKFVLSGYNSPLYAKWEESEGWNRVDIEIDNKASSKKTKEVKTECLWMNY